MASDRFVERFRGLVPKGLEVQSSSFAGSNSLAFKKWSTEVCEAIGLEWGFGSDRHNEAVGLAAYGSSRIDSLLALVGGLADALEYRREAGETPGPISVLETFSPDVFIIFAEKHRVAALELSQLILDRFHPLKPVLLKKVPHRGRDIIEKFEETAQCCGFAFAILTPDDLVTASDEEYPQMRPNVAFELGWFYGHLTRRRTCILRQVDARIPSDITGAGRYDFVRSPDEVLTGIHAELSAAYPLLPF